MGADGGGSNGVLWQRSHEADGWLAWLRRFWSAHLDALRRYLDNLDQIDSKEGREEEKDD